MQAADEVTGPETADDAADDDYEAAGDAAPGKLLHPFSAKEISADALQPFFIFLLVPVTALDTSSMASSLEAVHAPCDPCLIACCSPRKILGFGMSEW